MCRFVAYLGPPVTLESVVSAPEHSLVRQSYAPRHQRHGRVNADGFGVGWYDRSVRAAPARYRSDRPIWSDRSLASMAGLVRSGAVLAAVRDATPPAAVEESGSPPFASGPWLFAHNGAVTGFAEGSGVALRRRVAPARMAGIEGASDSEVVFALVLGALDAGADLAGALAAAVAAVESVAPARLNLVLTDGVAVAASASGDTLFLLDDPWSGRRAGRATVVASEPYDDDPRWVTVPDRSIVCVSAGGATVAPLGSLAPPTTQEAR
ncbi:MAG: ergothioneine biosynthesis protein EgtC [Actinobacteria bacterium]|nr:ergothioneine biosynthesis protein EgtC [Actinomycetota bacterium]